MPVPSLSGQIATAKASTLAAKYETLPAKGSPRLKSAGHTLAISSARTVIRPIFGFFFPRASLTCLDIS